MILVYVRPDGPFTIQHGVTGGLALTSFYRMWFRANLYDCLLPEISIMRDMIFTLVFNEIAGSQFCTYSVSTWKDTLPYLRVISGI